MVEAAPTPCSRTGFHIITISLCLALLLVTPAVVVDGHGTTLSVVPLLVVQVGSTMIKSPGSAPSMALWMVPEERTCVGALPPTVTVTVSTDCLPLPAVMTSSPHSTGPGVLPAGALWVAYCACC